VRREANDARRDDSDRLSASTRIRFACCGRAGGVRRHAQW
jgi:hypothetical protein